MITGSVSDFNNPPYLAAMLRWNEKRDDGYKAVLDGSHLFVTKRGIQSIGTRALFPAHPNVFYNLKFQASGTTLLAKAWKAGDKEPDWAVNVTDAEFSSGLAGIRVQMVANTTITISSFSVTSP